MIKIDTNFVLVSISPLHHLLENITSGSLDKRLKSDLKFISEKINIQCSPLPIAYKYEKKIFDNFYNSNLHPIDTMHR